MDISQRWHRLCNDSHLGWLEEQINLRWMSGLRLHRQAIALNNHRFSTVGWVEVTKPNKSTQSSVDIGFNTSQTSDRT
ncbi:MAG: hypothetical protein ACOVQ7_05350 [Limnoraphis robusta]